MERNIKMNIIISTCLQGLIYSILALGVFISFRILNFADMTAESSLTLGGSVCALLITKGFNPILAIIVSGFSGLLAGLITGLIHTKLKIPAVLSGILTMIALYSINIRIMGKSNLSLLGKETIFKLLKNTQLSSFIMMIIICVTFIFAMDLFFKTRLGLIIRATGDNEQMVRIQGSSSDFNKIVALMISNMLCAISGALIAQSNGYSDINLGTGCIVIALSSIMIGESIIKKSLLSMQLIGVVLGSICYRFIVFLVLNLGMNPIDLKLFTSLIAVVLLCFPSIKKTINRSVQNVKNTKFK